MLRVFRPHHSSVPFLFHLQPVCLAFPGETLSPTITIHPAASMVAWASIMRKPIPCAVKVYCIPLGSTYKSMAIEYCIHLDRHKNQGIRLKKTWTRPSTSKKTDSFPCDIQGTKQIECMSQGKCKNLGWFDF